MPVARILSDSATDAASLAAHLHALGYTVELASLNSDVVRQAELEIRLERCVRGDALNRAERQAQELGANVYISEGALNLSQAPAIEATLLRGPDEGGTATEPMQPGVPVLELKREQSLQSPETVHNPLTPGIPANVMGLDVLVAAPSPEAAEATVSSPEFSFSNAGVEQDLTSQNSAFADAPATGPVFGASTPPQGQIDHTTPFTLFGERVSPMDQPYPGGPMDQPFTGGVDAGERERSRTLWHELSDLLRQAYATAREAASTASHAPGAVVLGLGQRLSARRLRRQQAREIVLFSQETSADPQNLDVWRDQQPPEIEERAGHTVPTPELESSVVPPAGMPELQPGSGAAAETAAPAGEEPSGQVQPAVPPAIPQPSPATDTVANVRIPRRQPPSRRDLRPLPWLTFAGAGAAAVAILLGWSVIAGHPAAPDVPLNGDIVQQVPFGPVKIVPHVPAAQPPAAAAQPAHTLPVQPVPASHAQKSTARMHPAKPITPTPRSASLRHHPSSGRSSDEDMAQDEVIVHHYKTANPPAKTQLSSTGVRHISDQ